MGSLRGCGGGAQADSFFVLRPFVVTNQNTRFMAGVAALVTDHLTADAEARLALPRDALCGV